ncbi:serine/threonine-protein phosphatase 6 regulatory subunit 3 isoform X2 [Ixodes scapularis]|uniref:serine/threonine-protein phosphatase 6 regulatory subunit 3 isoform X2 n=2 Tax=Ixodes scapularis TaxID=6945 RepID=UPI001A9F54CC|nr:serine/threonine-protein phosphatase 6 regulatory subunit 3 isoform X2 [Ixodes scapularis]
MKCFMSAVNMFWKFNLITTSHLETLLGKENVTLKELMDEEDILQECKAQTKLLIEFLIRPDVMDELVSLIIQEPAEDIDEKLRYKYPNIACEILTSDVPQINEALVRSETLMAKLLGYLEAEPPLNPLLASFFSKTAGILVSRRADTMFYACMQKENFVNLLLKHIDTSAIMDLLLKFVACADSEILRTSITQWLDSARVVQQLVALIDPSCSEDHHSNAAEALCEMIKLSREQMSLLQEKAPADPLLESLESTETVAELLNHMFSSDKTNESVFVNGISVLLSLLEFRKQGLAGQQQQLQKNGEGGGPEGGLGGLGGGMLQGETACFASLFFRSENTEQMTALDVERLRAGVGKVLAAVLPRLGDFLALLADPPQKISWTTTFGLLDPPLGQTRLEVCHLVNALINSNDDGVNQRLADLGALPTILELFFAYSWNNFLHTQVVHMVSAVMSSAHGLDQEGNKVHPLLDQLLGSCTLVQRCLDAWEANTLEQSQPGKHRRGYMGHLTKIVNDIVAAADNGTNSELVKERLKELPEEARGRWETFINETLAEVNRKNTMALGGVPNASSTEDDECIDLREVSFHQETALQQVFPRSVQQAFSDYQMEQVTSNFVEQFGFNDDEFVEADENLVGQLDQLGRVNFQLPAEVNMTSAALFDRVCREKGQTLDDADSDDDIWEDKEVVLSPATRAQRRLTDDSEEPYSSDSDEEGGATQPAVVASSTDEAKMDIDHVVDHTVAMDTTSPWDSATAVAAPDAEGAGWASFDNFANFSAANFETVADTTTPALPVAMETAEQPPPAPSPAASAPSRSADEPDSSKKPDAVRLESSSSSNTEVSSAEALPPAARSAEPVASSSAEINSAEVSSSADANKSTSGASEEGPADSSPACSAAMAASPPPAPACANGPLPSPSPPGDKMAPLDGPHRPDENECDSATTEAGSASVPSLSRSDTTPAAAPTTRPPAPPPPVQNGPL